MVKAPTTGSLAQEFRDKEKKPGDKRQYHLGKKIYLEREVRAKVIQPPLQEKTKDNEKTPEVEQKTRTTGVQNTEMRGGQKLQPSPREKLKEKDIADDSDAAPVSTAGCTGAAVSFGCTGADVSFGCTGTGRTHA